MTLLIPRAMDSSLEFREGGDCKRAGRAKTAV
jgi:hypothetical protein